MRTWTTPEGLVFEDEQTGDGRLFVAGSLTWEEQPNGWPLRWDIEDDGGHAGAVLVGAIGTMTRNGAAIGGTGTLDDEQEHGAEVARQLDEGAPLGVSVDLDDMEVEFVLADPEEVDEDDGDVIILAASLPTGRWVIRPDGVAGIQARGLRALAASAGMSLVAAAGEGDPTDGIVLFSDAMDEVIMRVTRARIRGATIVDMPAFARAAIVLDAADAPAGQDDSEPAGDGQDGTEDGLAAGSGPCVPCLANDLAVVAAASSSAPPRAWFRDPNLQRLTPMRFSDDGEVVGHIAPWGQCHTGGDGQCVMTPRSRSGYAWFRQGYVQTREGDEIPVGAMTIGGGHADPLLSFRAALHHYDDAATRFADVTAGEDAHGVWVHGAIRPNVLADDARMREIRAAPPSGDWRWIDGGLELVLAHSVNSGGFPVPRAAVAASGHLLSLVAAGGRDMATLAVLEHGRDDRGLLTEEAVARIVEAGIEGFMQRQQDIARARAVARLRRVDPVRRRAVERLRG